MIVTSCGIIAFYTESDGTYKFLVGHPGGNFTKHKDIWTLFKGQRENGESDYQCAIREFLEETGLDIKITRSDLTDLGEVRQNTGKKVHAYALRLPGRIDISKCHSNTTPFGWAEIDRYEFMTYQDLKGRTPKPHLEFYDSIINSLL